MTKDSENINKTSSLAKWYIRPAGNWKGKSRGALKSAQLSGPFMFLTISILTVLGAAVLGLFIPDWQVFILTASLVPLSVSLLLIYLIVVRTQHNLLSPLTHMRHWALRMRGGNLAARLPQEGPKEFVELAEDINSLSESLRALTKQMKNQVERQTEKAEQKAESLQVLYDVASCINNSHNLEELLTRFLHTMKDIMDAKAATVRLLTDDGHLRIVASVGLEEQDLESEHHVPVDQCSCGRAVQMKSLSCQDVSKCHEIDNVKTIEPAMKMLAIPMLYRGEILGIYNLYVPPTLLYGRDDLDELLNSIGKHLGVAIAKARDEKQNHRLAIMEERTLLSHELHDSLAQTLVSLKMQVSVLDESSGEHRKKNIHKEIQQLYQGLDKANEELRELLGHFRTPMDERGLVPALEDCVRSFERESNISIFFQNEINGQSLPPAKEVQVLHIVQESLSNIRKHSRAHHVRLLIKASEQGKWSVIIEDDGIGINKPSNNGKPGRHIGLNIMQERCKLLNGELNIESEAHEGTRVELLFESSPYLFREAANNIYVEEESVARGHK